MRSQAVIPLCNGVAAFLCGKLSILPCKNLYRKGTSLVRKGTSRIRQCKESNESTVMYQVKSRITPITDRKRNGNGSETDGNGTIDKDVFSLIKSRAEDTK